MDSNNSREQKVKDLQMTEQNVQNLSLQKQTSQVELNEINNALAEIEKTDDEIYKILGGIMIKTDKSALKKELGEKKKLLELRIQAIEKQEKLVSEKAKKLRSEISQEFNKKI